jgi:cell wall-associated NlpC family hydrolase
MKTQLSRLIVLAVIGTALLTPATADSSKPGSGYSANPKKIMLEASPQPAARVLEVANSFKGLPYVWAGKSAGKGFDCSGYLYEVMRLNGYEIPRMADHQFAQSTKVSYSNLQPGDMVFFSTYMPGASHCGLYLGNGKFIHASSAGGAVIVSQMKSGYYRQRFVGGGRPNGWLG